MSKLHIIMVWFVRENVLQKAAPYVLILFLSASLKSKGLVLLSFLKRILYILSAVLANRGDHGWLEVSKCDARL